jgi:hypothetical protein
VKEEIKNLIYFRLHKVLELSEHLQSIFLPGQRYRFLVSDFSFDIGFFGANNLILRRSKDLDIKMFKPTT